MGRADSGFFAMLIFLALAIGGRAVFRQTGPSQSPSSSSGPAAAPPSAATTKIRERETPDLSPGALCERLSKASPTSDTEAVYHSIRRDLLHLTADEIVNMLTGLSTPNCASTGTTLEVLLLDLLAKKEPALTADYMLTHCKAGDIHWDFFSSSLFDLWIKKDAAAAVAWLDSQRDHLPEDASLCVVVRGETSVLTHLFATDVPTAMERARSFPPQLAFPVIDTTFRQRSDLLPPNQAIDFLRDGLGRENHAALVGFVCGMQLYAGSPDALRAFFRTHEATLAEREAIIREVAKMKVGMGFGGDVGKFLAESRQFAEEDGPGAVDYITAVILGETSDRDRQDRQAVDQLLGFNPDDEALRTFLEIRANNLEKSQRLRVEARLSSR
jgi:hypothetical protein